MFKRIFLEKVYYIEYGPTTLVFENIRHKTLCTYMNDVYGIIADYIWNICNIFEICRCLIQVKCNDPRLGQITKIFFQYLISGFAKR